MKLTRRQVAAHLRKSIATVRRLEGHVLHPHRDSRGTYWFDSAEVERLHAHPRRAAKWAQSNWLRKRLQATEGGKHRRPPTLLTVLDACGRLIVTARRGRFASRNEVIVSAEAFSGMLDALEFSDND